MLADFIGSTTEESLEVAIDSGNLQLDFGESVLLIIHNPLRFCLRLFVDFKMGLAESYMAGDWEAKPSPKRFLELLIRSKRG